jgi:3,4-dihydroxy 2-butanone 4-phosphate synthase/GTP cyclohydrolase II
MKGGRAPMFHTIEEAIRDLKQGKVGIVVDDEDRENEGDFVALADTQYLK